MAVGGEPDSGVVAVVAAPCPRTKSEGVIVGAEDIDDADGIRRGRPMAIAGPRPPSRSGEADGEREMGEESAVNAGEERADSNVSKREEEGVW